MEKLTHRDFYELLEYSHPHCISIYMPTEKFSAESKQNQIRFRDMADKVFADLSHAHLDEESKQLISDAFDRMMNKQDFWRHQDQSLAFFVAPGFEKWFRLPLHVTPLAVVSQRFHLKPLIPLIAESYDFFLLSITRNAVKLYKGDSYEMKELHVPDMPTSLQEALALEEHENELQFHTSTTSPTGGERPAMFHGHASWKDEKKKSFSRFLHKVNHPLEKFLQNEKAPLLFSGVKYMCVMFSKITHYPHFVKDKIIQGNTESWTVDKLHKQALEALQPYFETEKKKAIERYYENGGNGRVASDLAQILREAALGKVDTLFVAKGVREWGSFDPHTLQVRYDNAHHTEQTHDLLDIACAQTLMNGGKTYVLPPEKVPNGNNIAAVLRY